MQRIPSGCQFSPMQLRPRFHESALAPGQLSGNQLDRRDSEYPDVVLIVGVKVRRVMRFTDLHKHPNDDAEEPTQLRHNRILALVSNQIRAIVNCAPPVVSFGDMKPSLASYPLIDALRHRRSRRFGVGMKMASGPMAFTSRQESLRLSEDEEALLAFAAGGVTGHALGDLVYTPEGGGGIMAGMLGRTVPSGDAIHTCSVFVINEDGTYLLKRPRDFAPAEVPELVDLAARDEFTSLYNRSRVKIGDGRSAPPLDHFFNLDVNNWALYDPASTYFLPVSELTLMCINGLLEIFNEQNGAFIVDERRAFQPAGVGKFARSRSGHLNDDPRSEKSFTIQQLETLVTEFVTIEQGMVLQNLGLMVQAMGLGGFPHWAAHPYGWFEALGFRTKQMRGTDYLGMHWLLKFFARLLGKDPSVSLVLGLEHDGEPLLTPYCPPYYASMEAAVRAVVDLKRGVADALRTGETARRESERVSFPAPSDKAIDATIAYCEYVHRRYGRFPAYQPPFRTVLGFQVSHVDTEFYDRFYRPEALSETQRGHMKQWH